MGRRRAKGSLETDTPFEYEVAGLQMQVLPVPSIRTTTNRRIRLLTLPPELIFAILDYLDLYSLLSFKGASKATKGFIRSLRLRSLFVSMNPSNIWELRDKIPSWLNRSRTRYIRIHKGPLSNPGYRWDLGGIFKAKLERILDGFTGVSELVTSGQVEFLQWKSVESVCRLIGQDTLQLLEIALRYCSNDAVSSDMKAIPQFISVQTLVVTVLGKTCQSYLPRMLPNIRARFPSLADLSISFKERPLEHLEFNLFETSPDPSGSFEYTIFPNLRTFELTVPIERLIISETQLHHYIAFLRNHPLLETFVLPSNDMDVWFHPISGEQMGIPPLDYGNVVLSRMKRFRAGIVLTLLAAPFFWAKETSDPAHVHTYTPLSTITNLHIDDAHGDYTSIDPGLSPFTITTTLSASYPNVPPAPSPWSPYRGMKILTIKYSAFRHKHEHKKFPELFPQLEELHIDLSDVASSNMKMARTTWYEAHTFLAPRMPALKVISVIMANCTRTDDNDLVNKADTKWFRTRKGESGRLYFQQEDGDEAKGGQEEKRAIGRWGCKL